MNAQLTRVQAFAPASVANLGVGFDVLGLALMEPGDRVIAEWDERPGVHVAAIENDGGRLPREAAKNTACVAAQSVLRAAGMDRGVRLTILKGIPAAGGMGSSAASAVAAAVAVNALIGSPIARRDLLPMTLDGEAVASGYHTDNVAPSLLGGITLGYGLQPYEILCLPIPQNIVFALVTPAVEVSTRAARAVLPPHVPLTTMVKQTAAIARLVDAIYRADVPAIGEAMEADGVIEPARAHLMPKLHEIRVAAKAAGAFGLAISGAGPTLLAVCGDDVTAQAVAAAMASVYDEARIGCTPRVTHISAEGARVEPITAL